MGPPDRPPTWPPAQAPAYPPHDPWAAHRAHEHARWVEQQRRPRTPWGPIALVTVLAAVLVTGLGILGLVYAAATEEGGVAVGVLVQRGLDEPEAGSPMTPNGPSRPTPTTRPPTSGDDDAPPPGFEEASAPLGRPPAVAPDNRFKLLDTQPDDPSKPVGYDPCRPIHIAHHGTAPPGGDALMTTAIQAIAAATGFRFVDDGATDEAPSEDREDYQPDRYPGRWAPVLLAWSDAIESPQLEGDVDGAGASSVWSLDDGDVYVTGSLVLDRDDLAQRLREPDGKAYVRTVIEHELGHVMGLDHPDEADDDGQVMAARADALPGFGAGDKAGLALVGSGACYPDI